MDRIAFVTGADRGLGYGLSAGLLDQGWRVCAGQFMPDWPELAALAERFPGQLHLFPLDVSSIASARDAARGVAEAVGRVDLLINNAGIRAEMGILREGLDYAASVHAYEVNALGPLRVVEAFLPLLDAGDLKRLCFVSSEAGSIARARRTAQFGYCMSKAALNMAVKIMFNDLRPAGYTFRLYHPGWVRSYMGGNKNMRAELEPEEAAAAAIPFFVNGREDEDRLVLVDYQGNEWPW